MNHRTHSPHHETETFWTNTAERSDEVAFGQASDVGVFKPNVKADEQRRGASLPAAVDDAEGSKEPRVAEGVAYLGGRWRTLTKAAGDATAPSSAPLPLRVKFFSSRLRRLATAQTAHDKTSWEAGSCRGL
jgi:hypothetical protein